MAALGALVVYAALRLVDVPEFKRLARFRRSELIPRPGHHGVRAGVRRALRRAGRDRACRSSTCCAGWPGRMTRVQGSSPGSRACTTSTTTRRPTRCPGLVVYRYDAPLFFANAENFRERALAAVDENPDPVEWFVLNAEANVEVDLTALDVLDQLRHRIGKPRNRVRDGQGQAGSCAMLLEAAGPGRQDRRGSHLH